MYVCMYMTIYISDICLFLSISIHWPRSGWNPFQTSIWDCKLTHSLTFRHCNNSFISDSSEYLFICILGPMKGLTT